MDISIKTTITKVLVSTGRISPKDRIEIIETSGCESDYARIGLYVYRGRRKHPYVYWNICIDMPRGLILWESSTFYYL